MEIKRVEPEGDGTTVCCTANGSKYTATIVEIIKKVYSYSKWQAQIMSFTGICIQH